jgi:hypothetical protein
MRKHRALLGYGLLVVALVVALFLYSRQQSHKLQAVDREACLQDKIIAANQKDVLLNLLSLRQVLAAVPGTSKALRRESLKEIWALQQDLRRVPVRNCNSK